MPEVIDNIKVGEFIKTLLKENNMTQESLAQKLMISKSAVSQNLNGKSSFDMQNLMSIAKIFNISLDDLLKCKKKQDQDYISEYVKFASKGLDEIKKYSAKDLQIQEPDIYGRVLVDYLIDGDVLDVFSYLHDQDVEFVKDYYHRAKEIYLKVLLYCLRNKLHNPIKYIRRYAIINNGFDINQTFYGIEIWSLINNDDSRKLIRQMIDLKIEQETIFMGIKRNRLVRVITKDMWVESIGSYKLDIVLDEYIKNFTDENDFYDFTKSMLLYEYYKGVDLFVKKYFSKEMSDGLKSAFNFQRTINLVIEKDDFELFKMMVDRRIYESLTEVIVQTVEKDQKEFYNYCLKGFENKVYEVIDYNKVGYVAIKKRNLEVLDLIKQNLDKRSLNYLLSEVKKEDIKTLYYLLDLGAEFDFKYYNLSTMANVNAIIKYLLKKEGK